MARARNIKPGFFTNEVLAELPFESRLLFIGLWTIADRAGRFHDRPKRIKMQVFPGDSVDVNELLEQLAKAGFVWRYEVDGERYCQIVNWDRHQNPHKNEVESEIPPPIDRRERREDVDFDDSGNKHREDSRKIASSTENGGTTRADSLIPDSLIQIPPIPPKGGKGAISLTTYLALCKAEGKKPIAEDDPVFAYASKAGIPQEFLRLHWLEFKDRYSLPDAKRYTAWATVFRKSVRGNWFRLWFIAPDGHCELTTTGLQAQRIHAEAA